MTAAGLWLRIVVYLGIAVPSFLFPGAVLQFWMGIDDAVPAYSSDQVRMCSPYWFAQAIFAFRRIQRPPSRPLVLAETLAIGIWAGTTWIGGAAGLYGLGGVVTALLLTAFVIDDVLSLVESPVRGAGGARSEQGRMWAVCWTVQLVILAGGSIGFLLAPPTVLATIAQAPDVAPIWELAAASQAQLLGALACGVVTATGGALLDAGHEARRRGWAWSFVGFLSVWAVTILWIVSSGTYTLLVLTVLLPGLVFLPMNLWLGISSELRTRVVRVLTD